MKQDKLTPASHHVTPEHDTIKLILWLKEQQINATAIIRIII